MCGSKNRNDACQVDAPQLFKRVSHPHTPPPSSFALGYFNHACVYPGRQRAGRQEMLISSMLFWWFPCSCRLDSNPARQRAGRQEAVVIHIWPLFLVRSCACVPNLSGLISPAARAGREEAVVIHLALKLVVRSCVCVFRICRQRAGRQGVAVACLVILSFRVCQRFFPKLLSRCI